MNRESKRHILGYLDKGIRYDGRKKEDYRDVKVETGVSKSAEGSARVRIGDTVLIAGIKTSVEKPYSDRPNEGTLMVNAELLPLSSPDFETGPPSSKAIELARVVDRGIRESKTIDVEKLCIEKGEKVWFVAIDICTINDAGNLLDAASLAAIAALKTAKLPKINEDGTLDYKELSDKKIPLTKVPVEVTVWKIGDHLLIDPLNEEEEVAEARLTVATIEDGSISALQKGEEYPLSVDEIDKMVALGIKVGKKLRSKL